MEERKDPQLVDMEANLQSLYMAAHEHQNNANVYGFLMGRIDALNAAIAARQSELQLTKYNAYTQGKAA